MLTRSSGDIRVFVSSAIAEFKTTRAFLHREFNQNAIYQPYQLWIYEWTAAEDKHCEEYFLRELGQSDLVVLLLGSELRPAVKQEIEAAKRKGLTVLKFLADASKVAEFEAQVGPLGHFNATWTNDQELLDAILDSLKNHTAREVKRRDDLTPVAPPAFAALSLDTPPAWQAIARMIGSHCDEGDYRTADLDIAELRRGAKTEEERMEVQNLHGFRLRREGRLEEAKSVYEELFRVASLPRFLVQLATIELLGDDFEAAEELLNRADGLAPASSNSRLIRAQILLHRKQHWEAVCTLLPMRKTGFGRHYQKDYCGLLGGALSDMGRHRFAEKVFSVASGDIDDASPITLSLRANNLFQWFSVNPDRVDLDLAERLIESAARRFVSSMLSEPALGDDFRSFIVTIESGLDYLKGRFELAYRRMAEFAESHKVDPTFILNRDTMRFGLDGTPVSSQTLRSAAEASGNETIWQNYLANLSVTAFNESATLNELIEKSGTYKDLFPRSGFNLYVEGVRLLVVDGPDSGVPILASVISDEGQAMSARMNALDLSFAASINKDRRHHLQTLLDLADEHGLWNMILVDYALKDMRVRMRPGHAAQAFEQAYILAARVPEIEAMERRRHATASNGCYRSIGESIFRMARIAGAVDRVVGLIDEVEGSLLPHHASAFKSGVGQAMV